MKAECLVENLEKIVTTLAKALPSHPHVPILANILLEARLEGLFLSSTDLEFGVRIKIPGKITEVGSLTIPGKQFIDVLHSLPPDKVSFETDKDLLFVLCRGNKISFQTIPASEFPSIAEQKGNLQGEFSYPQFRSIFSPLVFSVSQDSARPQLTGILFKQAEGKVDVVSTDGFRLSLKRLDEGILTGEERTLILSSRLINEALSLKGEGTIKMYIMENGNQAIFESDDTLLVGRLIEGEFPPYQKVLPQDSKTECVVGKEEFIQAVRLISVFAQDNIVRLKVTAGEVFFFARTQGVGEGEIKIDCEKEGENNEIAFNFKFLLDFLKNTDSEKIIMRLNDKLAPGEFSSHKDPAYRHIIMPVRMQEDE